MALKQGQWLSPDEKAFLKSQKLRQGFTEENVSLEVHRTAKMINRQEFIRQERITVEKEQNIEKNFKDKFNELRSGR